MAELSAERDSGPCLLRPVGTTLRGVYWGACLMGLTCRRPQWPVEAVRERFAEPFGERFREPLGLILGDFYGDFRRWPGVVEGEVVVGRSVKNPS